MTLELRGALAGTDLVLWSGGVAIWIALELALAPFLNLLAA